MANVSLGVIMSINVDQTQNAYTDFRGCRRNTTEYPWYIPKLKVYPQILFNSKPSHVILKSTHIKF